LSAHFCKKPAEEVASVERTLIQHVCKLVRILDKTNEHFVYGILSPDEHLSTHIGMYSPGSVKEMQLALQYSYPAWWQTEGAIDLLQSAKLIALRTMQMRLRG